MKRLHIHIGVEQLEEAIGFYSRLFGAEPVKRKARLCQMDARRSPRQPGHLHANFYERRGSLRHSGGGGRGVARHQERLKVRESPGSRRRRDPLLLCQIG